MYLDQTEEGPISLQRVATAYKTADVSPSFLDYVERLAEQQDATGHIRNAKTYRKFKHKLELFKPGGVVFADIDIAFVTDFETFLSALPNQRRPDQRLSVNSIHTEMKTFRAILQRAVAVDKIIKDTPFRDYKLREEKKPPRINSHGKRWKDSSAWTYRWVPPSATHAMLFCFLTTAPAFVPGI